METPPSSYRTEPPLLNPSPHLEEGAVEGASSKEDSVLYLEAHDPRAQEFNCNAQEAMEALGIKRSRLTQISGQTLPCARIKIGRYQRPMYRKKDLEQYIAHLRIPASRAQTSHIIERGVLQLQECAEKLTASLSQESGILSQTLEKSLEGFYAHQESKHHEHHTHIESLNQKLENLTLELKDLKEHLNTNSQKLLRRQEELQDSQSKVFSRMHYGQNQHSTHFTTLEVKLKNLQKKIGSLQPTQTQKAPFAPRHLAAHGFFSYRQINPPPHQAPSTNSPPIPSPILPSPFHAATSCASPQALRKNQQNEERPFQKPSLPVSFYAYSPFVKTGAGQQLPAE